MVDKTIKWIVKHWPLWLLIGIALLIREVVALTIYLMVE